MCLKVIYVLLCWLFLLTVLAEPVPWTIEPATKTQITNGLVALDEKLKELKSISIDPSLGTINEAKFLISYIFSSTTGQLHAVIDALFNSKNVNKTVIKIDGARTEMAQSQEISFLLETDYGLEKATLKRKIWKAMNASVEDIWKALRAELVQSEVKTIINSSLKVLSTTMNDLEKFIQFFVDDMKMCAIEISRLKSMINSTTYFDTLIKQVDSNVTQCVKEINNNVANLNYTIFASYTPVLKNSLISNKNVIDHLLQKLNKTIDYLYYTSSLFQLAFNDSVNNVLTSQLPSVFDNLLTIGLERTGVMIFKNSSKYEICSRKYPLTPQILFKYTKLVERCVQKQLDYLPNIVLMMKEFLKPFREVVFAPVQSLKACSNVVGGKFCSPDFMNTFLVNITDAEINTSEQRVRIVEVLNTMAANIFFSVFNELGSALNRISSCTNEDYLMKVIDKFVNDKLVCGSEH